MTSCIFMGCHAIHLCEDCASKYDDVINIVGNVKDAQSGHSVKGSSTLMGDSDASDRVWFFQQPWRKFRFRPMTPEEKSSYPGRDAVVVHHTKLGALEKAELEFNKPCVRCNDPELLARIYFSYAIYMKNYYLDSENAMHMSLGDEGLA